MKFSTLLRTHALVSCLAVLTLGARTLDAQVVINEIHYESGDGSDGEEFVELLNAGDEEVDISGWFFSSGIRFRFPAGVRLAPAAFAVVAQNPQKLLERFSNRLPVTGPFEGRLANDGERVVLRDTEGAIVDEVDYGLAFPWPTASAGKGSSMELIHPSLDNDLGGSWRASGLTDAPPVERRFLLERGALDWRYRRGTSEASDPVDAWRQGDFIEDASWLSGPTPIGYGEDEIATVLDDMRGNFTSVFLRRNLSIASLDEIPAELKIGHAVDDGCIVWINGVEVFRLRMPTGDVAFDERARTSGEARWLDEFLPPPDSYLQVGENTIAIHAFNQRDTSGDFSIDIELFTPGAEDFPPDFFGPPTPGAVNSVWTANAPPQARQVAHGPRMPGAGEEFAVSAKVSDPDGVASVRLEYQIVEPGAYVPATLPLSHADLLRTPDAPREDNPEYIDPARWTEVVMAADDIDPLLWSVILPPQPNRTLVRYRMTVTDTRGASTTIPYRDDPSRNFALFVYDGVPAWQTTARTVREEGVGFSYPVETMRSLAAYHLISRAEDITRCVAASTAVQIPQGNRARHVENWEGAFVYDGVVYDHVEYRLRGANGRYQVPAGNGGIAGKRHWRINFNKGHHLQARDRFGNRYPTRWRVLNTGRMFGNRIDGNWGLGDQVNDILWNAWGIPAAFGHAFSFRVIDSADESPVGEEGQYHGDFWGIARAFENYDVRFLEAHDLPKGNLYKLVNQTQSGIEQRRYRAPGAVDDGGDHDNIERNLRAERSDEWLLAHVHYDAWYRYHSLAQALRHYDYWPSANKNATWYFEPDYREENGFLGRMWTLPFDADATWGPTWNAGQDRPYDVIFAGGRRTFQLEYRNHIREVRDLLWQEAELAMVIRQTASFMDELEEADIDRWRSAPVAAGRQYFGAPSQSRLEGKFRDMMNFAFTGGSWPGGNVAAGGRAAFLDNFADGPHRRDLPETPAIEYVGSAGHPVDGLAFEVSPFADPQGAETFDAVEWRIAETTVLPADPASIALDDAAWSAAPVHLEIDALWRSGALQSTSRLWSVPAQLAAAGRSYRVRARYRDATGLWSHWSSPVQFLATEALAESPEQSGLRVTEVHYNPLGDDDYEFLELINIEDRVLDLRTVSFRRGIEFEFSGSEVEELAPGERVVLVRNLDVFQTRYGELPEVAVAGEYSGRLGNAGDTLEIVSGAAVVQSFTWSDEWYPTTDGLGRSLVAVDARGPRSDWSTAEGWRASVEVHGSPGSAEPEVGSGGQLPGDANRDGRRTIADVVDLLRHLFAGDPLELPCGDGSLETAENRQWLDINGDGGLNASDPIALLNFLFRRGPAPALGSDCVLLPGCTDACSPDGGGA